MSDFHWPRIDLNDVSQRRTYFGVALLTMVNVLVVSLATRWRSGNRADAAVRQA